MKSLIKWVMISIKREEGATAIEYALMVALIAVAIIAIVTLLGKQIVLIFEAIITALGG